ncbi:SRA stem-loop-interacting RNA-binding protein, mitochondrial [Aplysia californica]|uniref:SRA stem-loop-interacting RNA-binding protein, mitochondrial n=1 Tax=Aplysia californica TaxID=6500 RepID=A0ABM0JCV3_APLCA|nr:SRA stem-loop-interacting RNA-binding protein, mitochondrial [Aplysia californica]
MSQSRVTLAVLNIGWSCMRNDLKTYFQKFGSVADIYLPMDYKTGFNKRVAFVQMAGQKGFEENILQDFHTIDGQEVTVKLRTERKMDR